MNITCPRCGFSRELPADRAPSKAVIATCPHCACRFRFMPGTGVTDVISEPQEPVVNEEQQGGQSQADESGYSQPAQGGWHSGGDDPLPPGAIVPGSSTPRANPSSASPDADTDAEPSGRRTAAGAGERKLAAKKHAQEDGEEKNLGNLWGLLGGKSIFGQRGSKQQDDRSQRQRIHEPAPHQPVVPQPHALLAPFPRRGCRGGVAHALIICARPGFPPRVSQLCDA